MSRPSPRSKLAGMTQSRSLYSCRHKSWAPMNGGESTASYTWTGWVWEITGWSSRLQENYPSQSQLREILEWRSANPQGRARMRAHSVATSESWCLNSSWIHHPKQNGVVSALASPIAVYFGTRQTHNALLPHQDKGPTEKNKCKLQRLHARLKPNSRRTQHQQITKPKVSYKD